MVQHQASADPTGLTPLRDKLVSNLLEAGCAAVGVCGVEPLEEARRRIEQRRAAGLHDGMQFVYRNPARSTDPRRALPSARSAIVAALPYDGGFAPEPDDPSARVARYASVDLYDRLRQLLRDAGEELQAAGHRGVVLADDNALVDRAIALRAGLGWIGKNTNLLVPGVGSWVVLGSLLTDAPFEPAAGGDEPAGCGSCDRCRPACPTGALAAPGVMDASKCLSWLLQKTGPFPREYRRALGNRVYGCDDCQEVCPASRARQIDGGFGGADGDGSAGPGAEGDGGEAADVAGPGPWVPLGFLLSASDEELIEALGAWYIPRRDPRWVRRNALVVAGNAEPWAVDDLVEPLRRWLRCGDDMLVSHAAWAARAVGREDLLGEPAVRDLRAVRAETARPHPDSTTLDVGTRGGETGADGQ